MSDETPPEPAPVKKTPGKGALIGVVVAMLAVGGGAGAFVVAPRLAPHAPAGGEPEAGEAHGSGEGGGEANAPTIRLDNIIVNPAGSQGTRFLMATVALQVPDEPTRARLQNREVEVRDTLVATLASQTLESLTRPGAREALKRSLSDAVQPFAGRGARVRVFLPQFVIQ